MNPPESAMLSVVIPARNESAALPATLDSIYSYAGEFLKEVVVVDNGSTDDTREIAESQGARVILKEIGTIASLRNKGIKESSGEVLLFLDADVELTPSWAANIENTLNQLKENPLTVTGSRCSAPDDGGFINRYWYSRLHTTPTNYINSGHLLTTRILCEKTGGFDGALKTAEDYDFCARARDIGGVVRAAPELVAIHNGYPRTGGEFIARERWHGRQDVATLRSIANSKNAMLALAHIAALIIAIAGSVTSPWTLLVYLFALMILAGALVIAKFPANSPGAFLPTMGVAVLYIWGRSLSFWDRLFGNTAPEGHRR